MSLPLIHRFPDEILAKIFEHLLASHGLAEITRATSTCHRWREIAIADTNLWLDVRVTSASARDPDTLSVVLQRSKKRPISLHLLSPGIRQLKSTLRIVAEHLARCESLHVRGDWGLFAVMAVAFAHEEFPLLRRLSLVDTRAVPCQQVFPEPPFPLIFPLPDGHALRECELHGCSLGDTVLPNLDSMHIKFRSQDLTLDDITLNPQIFLVPTSLRLEGICVPPMMYPPAPTSTQEEQAEPFATTHLQSLVLKSLRATPIRDEWGASIDEENCGPFFRALDMLSLRSLTIDRWHHGRILDDFLFALDEPEATPKFPNVTDLFMRGIDFGNDSTVLIMTLLYSFPVLTRLKIYEAPDWANEVIDVLSFYPALCPGVCAVLTETAVLLRDDGLPFRRYMLVYPPDDQADYSWELDQAAYRYVGDTSDEEDSDGTDILWSDSSSDDSEFLEDGVWEETDVD